MSVNDTAHASRASAVPTGVTHSPDAVFLTKPRTVPAAKASRSPGCPARLKPRVIRWAIRSQSMISVRDPAAAKLRPNDSVRLVLPSPGVVLVTR